MMCKFGVSIIQAMLEDHQENIKEAMKKLCGLFPGAIGEQCKSMVDTYITIMINMVTKGATPEMICKTILMCNPITKRSDGLIAREREMRGMGLPAREWADVGLGVVSQRKGFLTCCEMLKELWDKKVLTIYPLLNLNLPLYQII